MSPSRKSGFWSSDTMLVAKISAWTALEFPHPRLAGPGAPPYPSPWIPTTLFLTASTRPRQRGSGSVSGVPPTASASAFPTSPRDDRCCSPRPRDRGKRSPASSGSSTDSPASITRAACGPRASAASTSRRCAPSPTTSARISRSPSPGSGSTASSPSDSAPATRARRSGKSSAASHPTFS